MVLSPSGSTSGTQPTTLEPSLMIIMSPACNPKFAWCAICRSVSMLWRWRRQRNDIDKCIRQVSGPQPRRQTREHAKDTNGHAPKGKNAPNKFG